MLKSVRLFILCAVCLISCFLFLQFPNKEEKLLKKLNSLSKEDCWAIDSFFRIFMLKGSGAYTLFGDKPVAYEAYFECSPKEVTSSNRRYWIENKQIREGWKTWEKYQHLFPSSRYLLQAKHLDEDWVEIVLIDKINFSKTFNENAVSFQAILGNDSSAEDLLVKYENDGLPLFHLLKQHHGLFGILLGFGKRNALLFQSKDRILEDFNDFTLKTHPMPSLGFHSLDEERVFYQKTLVGAFAETNHKKDYKFLYLPAFLADPHSTETQELQKKYIKQRRIIQDAYSHGHFLEVTLKKFCSE